MEEHSYNNNNVPLRRMMLALAFLFWLFIHVDIAKALSNELLPIFIFINFIIFALCFLSSHDDDVGSYRDDFPIDDVESVSSLSEEEMERCCNSEEIIVDKHIILVEDDVGDMGAFSSNNSDEDWEHVYPSNIDPNFNWQFF
ncbi:hypothetical protein GOBAR_AA37757 [Gossypium barbadense]|uniref:Transmembrane protein n=2 Tax=Gossypium TaxID=3633 RepID=A0ABR0PHC1_GOSAR|nr:hypothetical protein PVK06_018586 [Gossypium arboreum]PPR82951.1 hypothetical protein GOBAR_AA37757 [Gossypium barbadense]